MRQSRSIEYSTSDLAREAGLHPNTIRRYVDWGLLPPVERSAAGYRRFTKHHLQCLRLARLVFQPPYPGKNLRASGRAILTHAVADDWGGALAQAYTHLAQVRAELAQAGAAASYLEHWAEGGGGPTSDIALPIRGAAERLGLTVDALRNWERNGLIDIPRDPRNGYRVSVDPKLARFWGARPGKLVIIHKSGGETAAPLTEVNLEVPPNQTPQDRSHGHDNAGGRSCQAAQDRVG